MFWAGLARADSQCGAGYIAVRHDSAVSCVACGDEAGLRRSSNFSASCVEWAGASYCAATDAVGYCSQCPVGTSSVSWDASAVGDCACAGSTFGPRGGPCAPCPSGQLCAVGVAQPCPVGNICVGGEVVPCPAGSTTSVPGASNVTQCDVCEPGMFMSGSFCAACPAGSYCEGGLNITGSCPPGTGSPSGSASGGACACLPGFYGDAFDAGGCVPCEDGFFCAGGNHTRAMCSPPETCGAGTHSRGCDGFSVTDVSAVCCGNGTVSTGVECVRPLTGAAGSWHGGAEPEVAGVGNGGFVVRALDAVSGAEVFFLVTGDGRVLRAEVAAGVLGDFEALALSWVGSAGPALYKPGGVATDSLGRLYISDPSRARVYRVDPVRLRIEVVAGGAGAACADNATSPLSATLGSPGALAWGDGYLYVADQPCGGVRVLDVVGGGGVRTLNTSSATADALAVSQDGRILLVSDTASGVVRKVDAESGVALGTLAVGGAGALALAPDNARVL
eukprot:3406713-Rhodomonas_salina.1